MNTEQYEAVFQTVVNMQLANAQVIGRLFAACMLTNLLLTGILLMQAYALIFRAPRAKPTTPRNWRDVEKALETAVNPPKFPLT